MERNEETAPVLDGTDLNPNRDWSVVDLGHATYHLTKIARQCFANLFAAHQQGRTLSVENIFPPGFEGERRVDKVFSRCHPRAWAADNSSLVGPDKRLRGYYRVNLGQKRQN